MGNRHHSRCDNSFCCTRFNCFCRWKCFFTLRTYSMQLKIELRLLHGHSRADLFMPLIATVLSSLVHSHWEKCQMRHFTPPNVNPYTRTFNTSVTLFIHQMRDIKMCLSIEPRTLKWQLFNHRWFIFNGNLINWAQSTETGRYNKLFHSNFQTKNRLEFDSKIYLSMIRIAHCACGRTRFSWWLCRRQKCT